VKSIFIFVNGEIKMENNVCPYLGLIDDPSTCVPYPDDANACHNIKPPVLLAFDYQRFTCLQAPHRECPGYVNGWKNSIPRSIRRRKSMISPSLREGVAWLILAIPIIILLWMGFSGRVAFPALDFGSSPVSTPTYMPSFTRTPKETLTPTEALLQAIPLTETITPTNEPDTPDITQPPPTQTPVRISDRPMVSVSYKTNCRTGPGIGYTRVGGLLVGQQAEIVGVSEDGEYWVIKNPLRPGECWLWGRYATVSGDTSGLPRVTPPPR
jgi:hypothetical protein